MNELKELSEKLKRMLPYFDLYYNGAYRKYAQKHPVRPPQKWLCLIPILPATIFLFIIMNLCATGTEIPPLLILFSSIIAGIGTLLVCLSLRQQIFYHANMLGMGIVASICMIIGAGISLLLYFLFGGIVLFFLPEDIQLMLTPLVVIAIGLYITHGVLEELYKNSIEWWDAKRVSNEEVKALEKDSCFLEFYNSNANKKRGWVYAYSPLSSFRHFINVELIDEYEIGSQVTSPVLTQPSYANDGSDYKWKIYSAFLNGDLFRNALGETGDESLFHYFTMKDDAFKIRNDEKERYILLIQDMIKSMPLPFNIGEIHQLLSRDGAVYYMQNIDRVIHTPNLSAIVASLMEQPPLQKLTEIYDTYARNFNQFSSEAKGTIIGESGERAVMEEFAFYANKWRILQNIRLEVNGQSVESDIIAVTPYGVFVVEVKNLGSTGSYNITVEKDGLWKKVMKNGRWKAMGSVSRQNTRHLHGIEEVVNEALQNDYAHWIQANSIIVFANDVVGIRNYSPNVIVRASEMVGEIRKHPICLDESQIEAIATILEQRTLEPKKYEMPNYGKDILAVYLDVYYRANALLPQIKPVLDIIETLAKIPEPPLPIDFSVIDNNTAFSLEDNEADYEAPAESKNNDSITPPSYYGGSDDDDGSSGGNYDSEYDSAVGNCEMGNSYSYSWYDPSYDSYAQDLRDNMGIK